MPDDPPIIHVGQLAAVVTEDGETVLREVVLPRPAVHGETDQLALEHAEEAQR